MGFDAKTTYQNILKNKAITFPKCYDVKTPVKILEAPSEKNLIAGKNIPSKWLFLLL
jgi:hypothetical protein